MSKDLKGYQNTLLGVTAAFIEGIILQPTVYWKNAQALRLPISINPAVIYRGTAASIFNGCQMMGLQFGFTGFYQKILVDDNASKSITQMQEFASAYLGGISSAVFACPVELIMIQQQLNGGSSIGTFLKVFKGRTFFRGLLPTVGRDSIYVTGMLGVTPFVQDYLIRENNLSINESGFYASIVGGILAAVPSHPFDMVKTCMQAKKLDCNQIEIRSTIQTALGLYNDGGIKRLYAGVAWRTFNITATVYIANECRVRMSPFFATL